MTNSPEHLAPRTTRGRAAAGVLALAALSFVAGGLFVSHTDAKVPALMQGAAATVQSGGTRLAQAAGAQAIPIAAAVPRGIPPGIPMQQGQPFSFANLVETVSPAVVTVISDRQETASTMTLPDNLPEQFRDFFRQFGQGQGPNGQPQTRRARAAGSGFIVDPNGYIVTNNHVIDDATQIEIRMPDGREFTAKVVGQDSETDVALLKVDGVNNLPTVAFGDDTKLRVGDWVVAVGNPFGLGGTVTAGIVSSLGRDIGSSTFTDYIQIDAPINQGNSGGPTFDLTGRVVGVNSAIFSPTGGSVGIGFAIPASTVQTVIEQLKANGTVARGWLGVSIQNLTPDIASSIGIPDAKGAIVAAVVDNSPAQRAGFQQGDVILRINGMTVEDSRDLTRRVASVPAGSRANFDIVRPDGSRRTVTATIDKRDPQVVAGMRETPPRGGAQPPPQLRENSTSTLGMSLMPLTPANRQQHNLEDTVNGVLVAQVDPNSEAAEKGFGEGDVIVAVGGRPVRTPAEVTQGIAAARAAGRDNVLILLADQRNGERFVALKVDE
jgi:serine protease Do